MKATRSIEFEIHLETGEVVPATADVTGYAFAGVQLIPRGYSTTTAVVEVKASLTGAREDRGSLSTAITPNMTSRAILTAQNVRDLAFLHPEVTTLEASTGKRATLVVLLTEE